MQKSSNKKKIKIIILNSPLKLGLNTNIKKNRLKNGRKAYE